MGSTNSLYDLYFSVEQIRIDLEFWVEFYSFIVVFCVSESFVKKKAGSLFNALYIVDVLVFSCLKDCNTQSVVVFFLLPIYNGFFFTLLDSCCVHSYIPMSPPYPSITGVYIVSPEFFWVLHASSKSASFLPSLRISFFFILPITSQGSHSGYFFKNRQAKQQAAIAAAPAAVVGIKNQKFF